MAGYLYTLDDVRGWNFADMMAARETGCDSYYVCDRDGIWVGALDYLMRRASREGYEVYLYGEAVMLRAAATEEREMAAERAAATAYCKRLDNRL